MVRSKTGEPRDAKRSSYHEGMDTGLDEPCEVCGSGPITALVEGYGLCGACLIAAMAGRETEINPGAQESLSAGLQEITRAAGSPA